MMPSAIDLIQNFQKHGVRFLDSMSKTDLEAMITQANYAYHTLGSPILIDSQFDVLFEYVRAKYPSSSVLDMIGALPEASNKKVQLKYSMPSMNKIKPDTNALVQWKAKFTGPTYVISDKLDGVSALYCCENGSANLYTRGNGMVGQDISHLIPYLRLPLVVGAVVRGELIVPKLVFDIKYKATFANARNFVAGIVNSKSCDPEKLADLHFVAYEVITSTDGQLIPSHQMAFLSYAQFETVRDYEVSFEALTNQFLSQTLQNWRCNGLYEVDGIIVSDNKTHPRTDKNPEHSFAFKMVLSEQCAETHVVDVIWTAAKTGYLKPTVVVEPIQIGGVTIQKATGFNGQYIESNKIGIGAVVQIMRSGDVIPYIKEVIVPATEPKMPDVPFKWNDTKIDVILENADQDPTVRIKIIAAFFEQIGVDGLREATARRLFHAGHNTIAKILRMTVPDFLTVDGFKEKTSQKLYNGIQTQIQAVDLPNLIVASNTFGRGFGIKKVQMILEKYPLVLSEKDPKKLAKVEGMAIKSSQEFVNRIPLFMEFLSETNLEYKLR
jgi:NAD-dependent DNA ligase